MEMCSTFVRNRPLYYSPEGATVLQDTGKILLDKFSSSNFTKAIMIELTK